MGGQGNARHFRERPARWGQRVADAPFKLRVGAVEVRTELGRAAQIGAGRQDAEAATQPRHAGGVSPMRRLAGVADDAEHIIGRELEDREPVENLAIRDAHAIIAPPRRLPCACRAFRCAHAHGVDEAPAEAGMRPEVSAQFPLDRSGLEIAGTPARFARRPEAPFLDPFEQGLAGRDGRQYQRHAHGQRRLDMLDRAGPLDLAERGVHRHQLGAGNGPRQQDGHGLAVLAA